MCGGGGVAGGTEGYLKCQYQGTSSQGVGGGQGGIAQVSDF